MFNAFYNKKRFKFLNKNLLDSGIIKNYQNQELISKTACFYSDALNVYVDTSDGVNEDLKMQEYCGRIKRVIKDSRGKRFLFFKSAYSKQWTKNIESIAKKNNGTVIPFFKWSFNDSFYEKVYNNREKIIEKFNSQEKIYDIGIFFEDKPYVYPKPSDTDPTISWSDHQKFNIPGKSKNTGNYLNNSRKNIVSTLKSKKFKILHKGLSYDNYIKSSFQCKVIINPPGIGEYTSRMVDQTYLGNCIALRKNSYDNGYTWKNHIPEIDFSKDSWEKEINLILKNYKSYQKSCKEYYDNFWTSESIVHYFKEKIIEFS